MFIRSRLLGATILRAPSDEGGGGALSLEQAAAAIKATRQADPAPVEAADPGPVEPVEAADGDDGLGDASQVVDDASEGLGADDQGDEPEGDDAEPEDSAEPDQPALDAPHFWAADDKAKFAALPRELQETVLAYEKNRDGASAKAIQEASEARKQAEQQREAVAKHIADLTAARAKLDAVAPEIASLQAKWPPVIDWPATLTSLTGTHGPDEGLKQYLLLKEEHAADQQQIAAAEAAKRDADEKLAKATKEQEEAEFSAFVQAEYAKLATVEPELVDPKHGAERRQAVVKFLGEQGVPAEQIRYAGAIEFSLAYDAMRFRQAKAGAAQVQARPKPQAQPAGKTLKPSAPPAVVPTATRRVREAQARFDRTGSPEDAQALMKARRGR